MGAEHVHPEAVHRSTPVLRIETLADGVFAIVMTILVFDLKAPDVAAPSDLAPSIFALWPRFLTYGISFVVLGVYWYAHHSQFRFIERTNKIVIWLNINFLAAVALVPFSTNLLGRYPDQPISAALYGTLLAVCGLLANIHWWYITRDRRFIVPEIDPSFIGLVRRRLAYVPLVALAGIALAFVDPWASIALYAALPAYFLIPSALDRYLDQSPEG